MFGEQTENENFTSVNPAVTMAILSCDLIGRDDDEKKKGWDDKKGFLLTEWPSTHYFLLVAARTASYIMF